MSTHVDFTYMIQGKTFPFLRPKTRGNEFRKLASWGTIFVGAKRQLSRKLIVSLSQRM